MLETHSQTKKKETYTRLEKKLEQITQYSNSRYYYHALLNKILEIANSQADPNAYLSKAQSNLKAISSDAFNFISWDEKGEIIAELTDETSYRYIIKTIHSVLKSVHEDSSKNYPGEPEHLSIVNQRLNLIRGFLGGFLVPEKLNLPLMAGDLAECILAGSNVERSYFWYGIGEKVSYLAFINNKLILNPIQLEKLVKSMNNSAINSSLSENYGYYDLNTHDYKGIPSELIVALAKFENYSSKDLETDNYLVSIRVFTPNTRVFCYAPKAKLNLDNKELYTSIMSFCLLILIAIAVALLGLFLKNNAFISIRWKLALLFIYANGLPLLILGFTGYEYLSQQKNILLEAAYDEVYSLFEDFDGKFHKIKTVYSGEFNKLIDDLNGKAQSLTKDDINRIYELAREHKAYDCIVSRNEGKSDLLELYYDKKLQQLSFWKSIFKTLLVYLEYKDFSPQDIFRGSDVEAKSGALQIDNVVLHKFLHKIGGISSEKLAQEDCEYYWNLIGDYTRKEFFYVVAVMWTLEGLQEEYLKNNIADLNHNYAQIQCFARIFTNGICFSSKGKTLKTEMTIDNLLRQTANLSEVRQNEITFENEKYVAFGILGKALDKVALVGLYPLEKINAILRKTLYKLIGFAILSLIVVSGIAMGLSKQFMEPVLEIEKGIQAISKQNYRHRTPIKTADEFGALGVAFNTAIESLEELEVAKVVQENLFPTEMLIENSIQIFGRSITMTYLGGDYFDYFSLDDTKLGVLMGDVSGHGVPAALVMAAAKATVLMAEDARYIPSELLTKLHDCIRELNKLKIKRMMTASYLYLDSVTGLCEIANAGHCYPILIKHNATEVKYIEFKGSMPLGIVKKVKTSSLAYQLEQGDTLLLYTDGIIEAANEEGESLGFERFSELLRKTYDANVEEYYNKIFAAYKEWAPESDDDLTMVLIKYEK
jgi:HAMP domain-containing protein